MTVFLAALASVLGLAAAVLAVLFASSRRREREARRNEQRGWDVADLRAIAVRTLNAEIQELQAQLESYRVDDDKIAAFLEEHGGQP